jgi:acetylornithine deacetylase/succinyl-diaminopimelate desuccinylase-like protein
VRRSSFTVHSSTEWVELEQLEQAAAILQRVITS